MRQRSLMLRDILLLTISALTLLIALIIGQDAHTEWKKLTQIRMLAEATVLGDRLFNACEELSSERDTTFAMLYVKDRQSRDDLQARALASRQDVDRDLGAALDGLKRYDFGELAPTLAQIDSRFAELKKLRARIDAKDGPGNSADPDLPKQWFGAMTDLIRQTQSLWMQFIGHYTDMDSAATIGIRFKYVLGIIMEYSGRQRAVIGQLLADNTAPTPQEQAQLLQWQGVVEMGWDLGNTLADQSGIYGNIKPYLEDAHSHYFTLYEMVRDTFYVPGAHHSGPYPIGVEFWLDLATQTTDSLNALKDAALKETQAYTQKLGAQARRAIIYHFLLLLFALLLCGYSFRVVIYRVIRPVNTMVDALVDASEGKPVAIEAPAYSRRDEIGQLAFVLHAFQQNADEMKRTSEALGESENKLHQAQKMEAIGNLTGGMAHDFNNLLGVIIGNLDILFEQVDKKGEQRQLTQSALDAALRGADLTRRLLAFARQQPLQPMRIEINALVEGITKLLSRTLGENIEIELNLGSGVWPVIADPSQLEAAITNLAANARDAMPKGGKLIVTTLNGALDEDYAKLHEDVKPGDYAVIEVSDTGAGMTPEVMARIFEPFFTTKERGKGTGLGLAMVFGFMKQSGGHVNVYSEVGKGTTFRLYLPRTMAEAATAAQGAARPRAAGGHETILVVEDNEAMRNVVVRQLSEFGYRVLEAGNGAAGLEMLSANKGIDLLFTDIVMPGKLDGMELARQATQRWPKLKVVLTSGFPENKLNGQHEPATGFRLLSKPYRKDDLARTVRETLERAAM